MVIRTVKQWLKDLFYDSTNSHLDSGRCIAAFSMVTLIGSTVWNMHLGKEINLSELGTGLSLVLGALVVYIYHDRKQNADQ